MKQITLFILLTLGLLFISCSDSNEINEGMIRYELSMGSTDKDTLAERKNTFDLFTDMKMNVYFKDGKTLVESSMMEDAMKFKILNDPEKQDSLIYVEMMGKKFKSSQDFTRSSNLDDVEISNVETFEDDRKVIAGYDAYKVEITMNVKGKDLESTAYVTEDFYFDGKVNENMIQSQDFLIQTKGLLDIKGTVLEQTITSKSLFGPMIMTATEVSTSVDDSVFEINEDEYKTMPLDAFSKANFPGFKDSNR